MDTFCVTKWTLLVQKVQYNGILILEGRLKNQWLQRIILVGVQVDGRGERTEVIQFSFDQIIIIVL